MVDVLLTGLSLFVGLTGLYAVIDAFSRRWPPRELRVAPPPRPIAPLLPNRSGIEIRMPRVGLPDIVNGRCVWCGAIERVCQCIPWPPLPPLTPPNPAHEAPEEAPPSTRRDGQRLQEMRRG